MNISDSLFVIPARGGSRGLPRKNILPLKGKPLICYTIDAARGVTKDENICVSTDDQEVIQVVEDYGLKVPFVRPAELASDTAGTYETLLHAIEYYRAHGKSFEKLILLQPTSPLRNSKHIEDAYSLWADDLDMVVSVKEAKANPYFTLFEEGEDGFLSQSKPGNFARRQDAPNVWEYNGAIYIAATRKVMQGPLSSFKRIRKYVMPSEVSIDIDSHMDYVILNTLASVKQAGAYDLRSEDKTAC